MFKLKTPEKKLGIKVGFGDIYHLILTLFRPKMFLINLEYTSMLLI